MFGWRARIGLLLPMDNAVMEPELYSLGLEGVSFHGARLATIERSEMPADGVRLSRVFVEMAASAVVYACAETSFLQGVDANRWIAEAIERETGLPALTATGAMVEALRALGVSRIGLVTPYTPERTVIMQEFLGRMGFTTVAAESRDFAVGSCDAREWYETNRQPGWTAYEMARKAAVPGAEALVISATNFRTLDVIAALEEDTGLPVISTNQAILWAVLGRLGVAAGRELPGTLWRLPWHARYKGEEQA